MARHAHNVAWSNAFACKKLVMRVFVVVGSGCYRISMHMHTLYDSTFEAPSVLSCTINYWRYGKKYRRSHSATSKKELCISWKWGRSFAEVPENEQHSWSSSYSSAVSWWSKRLPSRPRRTTTHTRGRRSSSMSRSVYDMVFPPADILDIDFCFSTSRDCIFFDRSSRRSNLLTKAWDRLLLIAALWKFVVRSVSPTPEGVDPACNQGDARFWDPAPTADCSANLTFESGLSWNSSPMSSSNTSSHVISPRMVPGASGVPFAKDRFTKFGLDVTMAMWLRPICRIRAEIMWTYRLRDDVHITFLVIVLPYIEW